jgi:pyridoxamine 5'-phosphate oxidase
VEDPIKSFTEWFAEAKQLETDATIVMLATATKQGKPSLRTVLLKAFDHKGFVFYTNLKSRKARELIENPQGALCFYWPKIDKQIRIEGKAELVDDTEADKYFATRALGSQIGAWASRQSAVMNDPKDLQQSVEEYKTKFKTGSINRPTYWSGFRIIPEQIEFWKRGEHRLHERILYTKLASDKWKKEYLYP